MEQHPFRVRGVVEESLEIMTPLADDKGLTLTSTIGEGTVDSIVGDPQRTLQVLLNLVSNAIKFTSSGRVDVRVRSRPLEDGRVEVEFAVSDSGPGIAKEDLDRLFVAFQQLDGSYSRRHGGAGLGLAISKRLTELMGGTISVETMPGEGSSFRFTIVGMPSAAAAILPARADDVAPCRRELRILLAEDEAINQIVVLDMLEQLGYRADSVASGTAVLEALERTPYDVILMDVQMPGLDGLEITRRIRGGGGGGPHIIALTAHALSGDRERCLAAGMNDYLSKPIRINDLDRALTSVG